MIHSRLSTRQMYDLFNRNILANQELLVNSANKINTGKDFNKSYENPRGTTSSINMRGQLLGAEQEERTRLFHQNDLDIAESSVLSIKNLIDRLREIALTGVNGSSDGKIHQTLEQEVRAIGESMIQLANTKSGDKYLFSGQQSNIPTVTMLSPHDDFKNVVYKNNIDNGLQKQYSGMDVTFDLSSLLSGAGQHASISGGAIAPVISNNGLLQILVNGDGDSQLALNVNLNAGDDLATIIASINAEYLAVGGVGTIAVEDPPYQLTLDASLVTGANAGLDQKIQVSARSSDSILNDLGLSPRIVTGKEQGIFSTMSELEAALASSDTDAMRETLAKIEANAIHSLEVMSEIGLTTQRMQTLDDIGEGVQYQLELSLSTIEDADFLEVSSLYNNAQARLESSLQTASSFFQSSLVNFIN